MTCPICDKIFPYANPGHEDNYRLHIDKHTWADFKCDCKVELKTIGEKIKHGKTFHSGSETRQCEVCGETVLVNAYKR